MSVLTSQGHTTARHVNGADEVLVLSCCNQPRVQTQREQKLFLIYIHERSLPVLTAPLKKQIGQITTVVPCPYPNSTRQGQIMQSDFLRETSDGDPSSK